MLKKVYSTLRRHGISGVLFEARRVVAPPRARCLALCQRLVSGRAGLEVGGPSGVFRANGVLPVYPWVAALDNCNFASRTEWEGFIVAGRSFRYAKDREPGMQYIAEMTDLSQIPSRTYDVLLSSHAIEHTANPVLALSEWIRVLKGGGVLVLLVPHKDGTFDHRRPVTTIQHLFEDFERSTREDDLTHLSEILTLHDLRRDPEAGSPGAFRQRSEKNIDNRCLHHHVFDTALVVRLLDRLQLRIHAVEAARPNHIIAIAQKPAAGEVPDNHRFTTADADFHRDSPFPSDRCRGPASASRTSEAA